VVTAQIALDLPDKKVNCTTGISFGHACARWNPTHAGEATLGYCVKRAGVREHTARIFLALGQIKGNLSSYGHFYIGVLSSYCK